MELLYLEIFLAEVYSEWSFPSGSVGKDCDFHAGEAGDMSLTPGSGRSPEGGHGNPLHYSCLENPMERGAWWATVHQVTKSQTQLKLLSMHTCIFRI